MIPELVVNLHNIIGEGPVYDDKRKILYWIDLLGNKIYSYNFKDGCVSFVETDQNIGCIAVREKGGLVAALQNGFYFVNPIEETFEQIIDPEEDKPNNRFNDGKCDSRGRFWAGTMSKNLDTGYGEYTPEGSVYCLDTDLRAQCKMQKVILSNGIDWSPDNRTMYHIDTPTQTIASYDFDEENATISNKRIAAVIPKEMGMPDGMCVDAKGMLWVALWGGSALACWDPQNGTLLDKIELPVLNVTSCAFGGEKLDELYITTASIGTDIKKYPDAGGVFVIRPGVSGIKTNMFKG